MKYPQETREDCKPQTIWSQGGNSAGLSPVLYFSSINQAKEYHLRWGGFFLFGDQGGRGVEFGGCERDTSKWGAGWIHMQPTKLHLMESMLARTSQTPDIIPESHLLSGFYESHLCFHHIWWLPVCLAPLVSDLPVLSGATQQWKSEETTITFASEGCIEQKWISAYALSSKANVNLPHPEEQRQFEKPLKRQALQDHWL